MIWLHKGRIKTKVKLCYIYKESYIVYIETKDIYLDITKHVEIWFDTSDYESDKLLPKRKNKKVIGLKKD